MKIFLFIFFGSILFIACGGGGGAASPAAPSPAVAGGTGNTGSQTAAGGTPNSVCHPTVAEAAQTPTLEIKVIPSGDPLYGLFYKCTKVFGLQVLAIQSYPAAAMIQVATIAAEYLDNNEDGFVDNTAVNTQLQSSGSAIYLGEDAPGGNSEPPFITDIKARGGSQTAYIKYRVDIFVDVAKGGTYCGSACGQINDSAIEHVPEVLQKGGYELAYPSELGSAPGTRLAKALDAARGGHFTSPPASSPAGAWYISLDAGIRYDGHMIEYFAWGLVTNLGLLGEVSPTACEVFASEWTLCTKAQFQATDTQLLAILTDSKYAFPTVAPNGSYR